MWLGLVGIVIGGLILIVGQVTQKTSRWTTALAILLILASVAISALVYMKEEEEKKLARYSGVLIGPTLNPASLPKVKIGDSNTFLELDSSEGEPLFRFAKENALVVAIVDGKLSVSTTIRGDDGQVLAKIVGNEWKVKQEPTWDRNYSDKALEVMNGADEIVLQLIFKDDYVQLAAKMRSSDGTGLAIGSKPFTEDDALKYDKGELYIVGLEGGQQEARIGDILAVIEVRPAGYPFELQIKPIFRYPSDQHLGELVAGR